MSSIPDVPGGGNKLPSGQLFEGVRTLYIKTRQFVAITVPKGIISALKRSLLSVINKAQKISLSRRTMITVPKPEASPTFVSVMATSSKAIPGATSQQMQALRKIMRAVNNKNPQKIMLAAKELKQAIAAVNEDSSQANAIASKQISEMLKGYFITAFTSTDKQATIDVMQKLYNILTGMGASGEFDESQVLIGILTQLGDAAAKKYSDLDKQSKELQRLANQAQIDLDSFTLGTKQRDRQERVLKEYNSKIQETQNKMQLIQERIGNFFLDWSENEKYASALSEQASLVFDIALFELGAPLPEMNSKVQDKIEEKLLLKLNSEDKAEKEKAFRLLNDMVLAGNNQIASRAFDIMFQTYKNYMDELSERDGLLIQIDQLKKERNNLEKEIAPNSDLEEQIKANPDPEKVKKLLEVKKQIAELDAKLEGVRDKKGNTIIEGVQQKFFHEHTVVQAITGALANVFGNEKVLTADQREKLERELKQRAEGGSDYALALLLVPLNGKRDFAKNAIKKAKKQGTDALTEAENNLAKIESEIKMLNDSINEVRVANKKSATQSAA